MLEYGHYLQGLLRVRGLNIDVPYRGKYNFDPLIQPYGVISVLSANGQKFQANEDMIIAENANAALSEHECKMELASFATNEYCILVFNPEESKLMEFYKAFADLIKDTGGFYTGLCIVKENGKTDSFKDAYYSSLSQAESLVEDRFFDYGDVEKAILYLHNHYSESIKLASLAEYVHLNESYLSNLIKKTTGSNFTDILNQIRVDEAKNLLITSSEGVEEISARVGFSSWSYFSRVFKKICGVSPAEYRKEYKNNTNISKNN